MYPNTSPFDPNALPFSTGLGGMPSAANLAGLGTGVAPAAPTMTPVPGTKSPALGSPAAAPAAGGFMSKIGGLEGLGTIMDGIGSIGQIYTALKGLQLARDQFDFSKQAFNTNLTNQTKTYNTALEDRARARFAAENRSGAAADQYIADHRL